MSRSTTGYEEVEMHRAQLLPMLLPHLAQSQRVGDY